MYLVQFCKESKYGTWVLTMLYLGLRPSETALIQKKDIQDGYVHIRGTKSPKADRYIPIPEALSFDLTGLKPNDYIFTTRYKTRLDRQSMKRWWGYFKRELDISLGAPIYRNQIQKSYVQFTPYTLRHTYGTRMQQSGVPIDVLADLMGHEKIETTRKYYIDDNFESKERYRKNINDAWKAPK
jgi:integrase